MCCAGYNTERDILKHLHLQQIPKKQLSELASSSSHSYTNLLNASNTDTVLIHWYNDRSYINYAVLDPRIPEDSDEIQR